MEQNLVRQRMSVGSFFFIMGLTFAAWASRISDVKHALGINDAELGTLLLCIPVGEICAATLGGWLVGRSGSRTTLGIAAVSYPGALLLLGLAGNIWALGASLFVFGMACSLFNIAVNTQAVSLEHSYGRSIMASFHGMWSLGGFSGGLIGLGTGLLKADTLTHFALFFVLALCIGAAFFRNTLREDVKKERDAAAEEEKKSWRRLRPERLIVILGMVVFGVSVCEGTMYDWSVEYFRSVVQPDDSRLISAGYVCAMCAMTLGRFTADKVVGRLGVVPVIRLSGAVVAAGLLGAVVWPQLVPASVCFFLVGAGVSSVVPLCYGMVSQAQRTSAGAALAMVSTIGLFGFLSGPPMIGYLSQAFGTLRAALVVVAGFAVLTAVVGGLLKAQTKP